MALVSTSTMKQTMALFTIAIILTYFHIAWFDPTTFIESDIGDFSGSTSSHVHLMTVSDLHALWKCLFHQTILKSIANTTTATAECNRYSHSLHYSLRITNISISSNTFNYSYRYILSIRRYIQLILQKHPSNNTNLEQMLLQKLHLIHSKIKHQIKHNLSMNESKYFLIHIMKNGGSTVCQTFNSLGYVTTNPLTRNCNIRRTQSAFKSWDFGPIPCSKYFNRAKKNQLLAYERVMHGHGTSNIPTLCQQFVYILPFRHPIRRMYSFLAQINAKEQRQPTDFIVKREVLPSNATAKQIEQRIKVKLTKG